MEGIQISAYYVGVQEDIALIQIGGYLDTVTSPHLEQALDDVITEGYSRIICDLGHVNYISSAGWGIFISKIKTVRDVDGDVVLSEMIPDVFDVFKLLEFDRILKFYDSSEKAVKEFDESRGLGSPFPQLTREKDDNDRYASDDPKNRGFDGLLSRGDSLEQDYPSSLLSPTTGDQGKENVVTIAEGNLPKASRDLFNKGLPAFPHTPVERNLLDRDLPLTEKVKLAVIDNPLAGVNTIRKLLNSSRFGYVNVGYFKLRKLFRELDLNTKEKRYRFWRSR